MKRLLTLLTLATVAACSQGSESAQANDQDLSQIGVLKDALTSGLLTAMHSKEVCSCHFVVGQPSDFCIRYVQQSRSDLFVDTDVNDEAKIVTAKALFSPTHTARFVSDKLGCKLD
jgi:hypothetical protein